MTQPGCLAVSAIGMSTPGTEPGLRIPGTVAVTGVAPQALQSR
jgi:hypothetical protein